MSTIIIESQERIVCPNCTHMFAINEGITRQTIERYERDYLKAFEQREAELKNEIHKEIEARISRAHAREVSVLTEQLDELKAAKEELASRIDLVRQEAREKAQADFEQEKKDLALELAQKEGKLHEFREQELKLRQEKKRLEEAHQNLELEMSRKLDEEKKRLEEQIRATETEKFRFIEAEYRKKIEDAHRANEELKRKLEQGSQQLQGEVLELELEHLLKTSFPFDEIESVRKGARGADVLQIVHTRGGQTCGRIIWEAKRSEHWSNNWIAKLKEDQQASGAELAVLVTTSMPKQTSEPFCLMDGVWVVGMTAVRPVAETLRVVLQEQYKSKVISLGRGEKMEALYDYLCSPQFAQRIRAVVDAFTAMKKDLDSERNSMERIWKKREKQLERVTLNMMGMCGELQGIARESLSQLDEIGRLPGPQEDSDTENL